MSETVEVKRESKKRNPFSNLKKPDLVIFRLVEKNEQLRSDTPDYPPYILKKNRDIINYVLPKDIEGIGKEGETIQLPIRYLAGETSVFVHEQEKNGRVIPPEVLNNAKNNIEIINGEIQCRPEEKTKIQFLRWVSWNVDSPYKSGKVKPIIREVNEGEDAKEQFELLKLKKEAEDKAFAATDEFMAVHCGILGISLIEKSTQGGRTAEAVRIDYMNSATNNPKNFLETFKNVSV